MAHRGNRGWLVGLGVLVAVVAVALVAGLASRSGDDDDSTRASNRPAATDGPAIPASAAPRLPVTVTNADGTSTTVTDVGRIVPLNGDITEVLFALGLGPNVVATDTSATYPAEAAALPKVGYQRTLSAEGILSFQPTLVVANPDAGPPAVIEQIRAAGVPVVVHETTPSLDAPAEKIRAIAEAVGVPDRGDALAEETQSAIDAAVRRADKARTSPDTVFLYLRGPSTQLIMGKGTGADVMIRGAGGTDVAAAAGITGTAPITAEALVAAAPEVILVTTRGLESVGSIDGILAIPGVAQTPAGQQRRIYAYDDQEILGGGPRTGAALAALVADLHPELGDANA